MLVSQKRPRLCLLGCAGCMLVFFPVVSISLHACRNRFLPVSCHYPHYESGHLDLPETVSSLPLCGRTGRRWQHASWTNSAHTHTHQCLPVKRESVSDALICLNTTILAKSKSRRLLWRCSLMYFCLKLHCSWGRPWKDSDKWGMNQRGMTIAMSAKSLQHWHRFVNDHRFFLPCYLILSSIFLR